MSVNSTVTQTYLAEVEAIKNLVATFVIERNSAQTQEDKTLVESRAITVFERLLDLRYKIKSVKPGDYPEFEDYKDFYYEYYQVMQIALAKLNTLIDLFAQHFNSQQYVLTDLLGKLKRVRQKRAALALWNNETSKFVLSEKFLNLDNLDTKFSSSETCYVESAEGVLTLPVRNRTPLTVNTVRVTSGSNGFVGNSDPAVTINNIDPEFTINGDPNNWFEYERLDSGPLELSLIVEFVKPEIVNNIVIAPVNVGQVYSYTVEDIVFTSNGQSINVTSLTGDLDIDRRTVKSVGNDSEWSLTFLPIEAKTISIKFKQTQSYTTKVASNNGSDTNRQRYSIGIQKLGFNKLRYQDAGGINSVERNLTSGLYAAEPVVSIWPPAPEFFDALLEVSFDGGENWSSADNLDDGIGSTVLMEGNESTILWRIDMNRNNDAIKNATTFVPILSNIRDVDFLMRPVSKLVSPVRFSLPAKPARGDIFVIQPEIAKRGDRFQRVSIGTGKGSSSRFDLPFAVLNSGLDPLEMHVYVNNVEYTYQQDDLSVAANEWSFSDDFQEIIFSDDLPSGSNVSFVFDEERILAEKRSDGFYYKMGILFDPDKNNINLKYFPRSSANVSVSLPRDEKIIDLGYTNINANSFSLHSVGGNTYPQVTTRAALISTPNSFLLDSVNGTLILKSEFGSDIVRANFSHQNVEVLDNKDYDVVYDTNSVKPWGIRIAPNAFEVKNGKDTVGGAMLEVVDPISGSFGIAPDPVSGADDAMKLSYNYLVKGTVQVSNNLFAGEAEPVEIEYVDGRSEFYGLIHMNSETTVETDADASGLVEFRLAAGALYYSPFGVSFGDTSVFNSRQTNLVDVNSTGEYHIASNGTVTVFVGIGNTLTPDISIAYQYKNPDFEPTNKYSVDYKKGIIYGGSDFQNTATVEYKASSHKVGYNVAREIDVYSYENATNSVSVRTEGLKKSNRLVKVLWAKETKSTSLSNLTEYFSPIISTLGFRFT